MVTAAHFVSTVVIIVLKAVVELTYGALTFDVVEEQLCDLTVTTSANVVQRLVPVTVAPFFKMARSPFL